MIKITDKDILNLNILSRTMLEWVDTTLRNKKSTTLPVKTSMKKNDGALFYNVMSCIIPSDDVAGVKIVTRYPNRNPALDSNILLYDLPTGLLKAMVNGNFITTWRTAAVAVHSIKLFAKKNYKSISFIGLGVIGKAVLKVYLDTLEENKKVEVRLFNFNGIAQSIIEEFKGNENITWKSFDNYDEMVKDTDVLVSAITFADKDFTKEFNYPKGILLVPVHTRGFQECDLTFDKIFGDDYGHIEGFKYFASFKEFNEVSSVLNNECTGRDNDEQRIIAYNVGIALHDISFANNIYKLLKK